MNGQTDRRTVGPTRRRSPAGLPVITVLDRIYVSNTYKYDGMTQVSNIEKARDCENM